jgi:septal ring factor EnvC (AmiA/AmiB activator)
VITNYKMKGFNFLFLLLIVFLHPVSSQNSVDKLRATRENTLKEIEYANKLLLETEGKTKESLNEINLINHKLSKRKEYLVGLEVEVSVIETAIADNKASICSIENDIAKIKQLYALLLKSLYKNKGLNYRMMYFFASESFNQLYRRIRTIKIYNSFLKNQKVKLEVLKQELVVKNLALQVLRSKEDLLLKKTKSETMVIQIEVIQKKNLVTQLKKKKREIESDIKSKEKTARKLEAELKRIIEEERKKSKTSGSKESMTPYEKVISNDFEKNIGRLPWPTQKGIVTGQYGEHPHPDYKSVIVRNDGIYISTAKGEEARSVFKGIVSRVFKIPGENYTVIIKHGQYYSLYHNLIVVKVVAGQSVNMKDVIGTVFTDEQTKETVLYFQIWNETEKRDPELWLSPI